MAHMLDYWTELLMAHMLEYWTELLMAHMLDYMLVHSMEYMMEYMLVQNYALVLGLLRSASPYREGAEETQLIVASSNTLTQSALPRSINWKISYFSGHWFYLIIFLNPVKICSPVPVPNTNPSKCGYFEIINIE